MTKEQTQVVEQYTNLLRNQYKHKEALEMTADLFAIDSETVRVLLEDACIIPSFTKKLSEYGDMYIRIMTDLYVELNKRKQDLLAEKSDIENRLVDIDKQMNIIEKFGEELTSIMENNNEGKKTNKTRKRKNRKAGAGLEDVAGTANNNE
jgi:hypothetical protein